MQSEEDLNVSIATRLRADALAVLRGATDDEGLAAAVAANYILELSSQELQQAIATELHDNPALELVDVPDLPRVRHRDAGSICPRCIQRQKTGSQTSGGDSDTSDLRRRARDSRGSGRRGVRSADARRLRADAGRKAA